MDGDRKYRQRGYQDGTPRESGDRPAFRPPFEGPKSKISNGPRLPRLLQTVTASRCYNCATTLQNSTDFSGTCPKCNAALHCCKQCAYFEPSTRFQCLKPVPERISAKDQANACTLFSPKVSVARDAAPQSNGNGQAAPVEAPKTPRDARLAFDNLFKK